MARKRENGGDAELRWREILKRQAGSGRSVRGFCRTEGISEPSFYAWRRKLQTRDSGGSPPRKTRRRGKNGSGNDRLFVPLKLLDAAPVLQIVHPLGYRIHVSGDVDPAALRQVIETLDERGAR